MIATIYTHPRMANTIFQSEKLRKTMVESGIEFVADPKEAMVLVANRMPMIRELTKKFGSSKKYLLWTHEPNFYKSGAKWANNFNQKIRTISLRSGEIFEDNYYYIEIPRVEPKPAAVTTNINLNRRIVFVGKGPGHNSKESPAVKGASLEHLRCEIALAGFRMGGLDIFGMGWPPGISKGESRRGAWSLAKYKILVNYHFNLCFENTLFPYYCSEKIWHSIYCGCLPIYFGQETIYKDFPRDSFLDYTEFGTPEALLDKVDGMSGEEFAGRYNKCLEVLEKALPIGDRSRQRAARYAASQIRAMMGF